MANPIINLKNKRNVVFTFDVDNELAEMTDEVCKLRMDADCIVIDEVIYSFNYKLVQKLTCSIFSFLLPKRSTRPKR